MENVFVLARLRALTISSTAVATATSRGIAICSNMITIIIDYYN